MKSLTGRISVVAALAVAALLGVSWIPSAHAQALTPAPPLPPLPPLPPASQPFQILTPPGVKSPSALPIVPAPVALPAPPPQPPPTFVQVQTGQLTNFTWDAVEKEYASKPGDQTANFTFWFTNTSSDEVVINAVRTSCGCTVAKLVANPWHIQPGTNGPIEVSVDLRGKSGQIAKAVTVESSAGVKSLIVKMNIPTAASGVLDFTTFHPNVADPERLKNMQDSLKDRQVVFKDAKCASCHADPSRGQVDGGVIYRGICATCHDSPLRAAAVTDLKALKHETDMDYWRYWITNGREGTMMPAYSQAHGGPLNDLQINALAAYCFNTFKIAAAQATVAPAPTTNASPALPNVSVFPVPSPK